MENKYWIAGAIKHPGALHRSLKVPKGQKISESKLKKAEHSKNPTLRKRAHLAETLKSFHHGGHPSQHHSEEHSKHHSEDKKMSGKHSKSKHSSKLEHMEEDVQHEKKAHKGLIGTLKKHFAGDEKHMRDEEREEEKLESKQHKMPSKAHRNMSKESRKNLAVSIMKKKMHHSY